jgi:recombination protein RecR
MDVLPKPLLRVIESFESLPGIGPKTAQRLAFYLLSVPQDQLNRFSEAVKVLKTTTVLCDVCKNITEASPCIICRNHNRDTSIICVVKQATDIVSIEKTGTFHGIYHVLHGELDPLNNIGPDEIYIQDLLMRIKNSSLINEVIIATNPTMEGEATAMYIQQQIYALQLPKQIQITRLAHGLPVGSDVEYADEVTLRRALEGRRAV